MRKAPEHQPSLDSTEQRPELAGRTRRQLLATWDSGFAVLDLPPGGAVTIGRDASCDLAVDHRSVSRVHATLRIRGESEPPTLEDTGSKNGTRIEGKALAPRVQVSWRPETVAELGDVVLVLHESSSRGRPDASPSSRRDTMDHVTLLLDLVAKSVLSVILTGETGVGKEVAARRIHASSFRSAAPFVALNCAALPEPLLESELFGYERGAFTGALQPKRGLLEAASGGTLLLDELGELPLTTQAKLLRTLETREVMPVGALRPRPYDARIVSATNRQLETLVESGTFRLDLYYRLNGISIEIPPLRERTEEIEPLARSFVAEAAAKAGCVPPSISKSVLAQLREHPWPGNVRELRNVVERAFVLSAGSTIEREHVKLQRLSMNASAAAAVSAAPARAPAPSSSPVPASTASPQSSGRQPLPRELADLERLRMIDALEHAAGNQTEAARRLGVSRRTFVRRLAEYDVPRPRKRT